MNDYTCLADGCVYPADFAQTGINLNEIVVGPTGGGKTMSTAYPRLLHTNNASVVVPIAKKALKDRFSALFRERGYQVIDLDFTKPERSNMGYDPLNYAHSDTEIIQLARNLISSQPSKSRTGEIDPYWNDSATSVLAAEIMLSKLLANRSRKKHNFANVVKMHRAMKVNLSGNTVSTSLDKEFEWAERQYPGNQASSLWKTVANLATRTASCIFSIVNNALDKIFSDEILAMMEKPKSIDFKALGERKIALFVTTSPMNKSLQNLVNLMYADLFRALFEAAEKSGQGELRVPVHIICDDFACGSRINDFEDYISIFRAAGISVTLLLQSESQLSGMYGDVAATTIINNCDSYVYMGGMDIDTCRNISMRINKPLDKVLSMPLEQVIVFRRGSAPVQARRYQTLEDPIYQEMMKEDDR